MKSSIWLVSLLLAVPARAGTLDFLLTRTQRAQKLVEEGQRQILRGNYLQAIDSCTRALGLRDDWSPAYLCRGEARLLTKDSEAAGRDANKAITLDPRSGEPYRILGILEYQAGRYPQAVEHFSRALRHTKMRPEDVSDVYYYRAYSKFNLERFQDALKDVAHGLGVLRGLNGDYADWSFYSLRAEILRRTGKEAAADAEERKVLKLIDERMRRSPIDSAELWRRRGETHAHLRQYADAAADYERLLAVSPEDVRALLDQASVYSLAGRHAQAVKALDRALDIDPANLPALRLRAMERSTLADLRGALADWDAALILKPDDAASLNHRGMLKSDLADYKGSLKDLENAEALNPGDSRFWGHRAYLLEMLEDHAAAAALAEKTLKADPNNSSARAALAFAGATMGRCDRAAPSLDWLISRSPSAEQYYRLRGECRCASRDLAGCVADMETARGLDPTSALLALRLAQAHRKYLDLFPVKASSAELQRSKSFYDRAQSLKTLAALDRLDMARTLLQLGMRRQAESELEAVLKKDPSNRKASELLRRSRTGKAP